MPYYFLPNDEMSRYPKEILAFRFRELDFKSEFQVFCSPSSQDNKSAIYWLEIFFNWAAKIPLEKPFSFGSRLPKYCGKRHFDIHWRFLLIFYFRYKQTRFEYISHLESGWEFMDFSEITVAFFSGYINIERMPVMYLLYQLCLNVGTNFLFIFYVTQ